MIIKGNPIATRRSTKIKIQLTRAKEARSDGLGDGKSCSKTKELDVRKEENTLQTLWRGSCLGVWAVLNRIQESFSNPVTLEHISTIVPAERGKIKG
jgi:hypothetical protein